MKKLLCDDCKENYAIGRNYYGGRWENLCKDCQKRNPTVAWKPLTSWKLPTRTSNYLEH